MRGPSADVVIVDKLVKRYPKSATAAVDGISFDVGRGEIFGLLGPNGAGKTTTIGVLTTRVKPTSGRAVVAGVDVVTSPVQARRRLAVVPQRNNLDRSLSIRQNLLFHAAYHGVPAREREARADRLLEQFGLRDRENERIDIFSGGQAQRAMIARALMHSPEVLFLDEPTTGLDPAARLFVWDRVRDLKSAGVTIMLTTHMMDEAATLSDRVGIMDYGRLLALDAPARLTRGLPGSSTLDLTLTVPRDIQQLALVQALEMLDGVERVEVFGHDSDESPLGSSEAGPIAIEQLRLYVTGDAATAIAPVAKLLSDRGIILKDARLGSPSLEDVFISLTGRALR